MSLKVVHLVAENFKRLVAIEITPEGNVVEIAGKNGAGKSSVLDAIWVALKGRAANPPEPIRQGEEVAYLELDLGKYRIVRKFTRQEGGEYTDFLRVEDPEGLQYPKPQQTLDKLLGAIGFDPFAFVQLKPEKQAGALLELVELTDEAGQPVNLEELRGLDKRIYDTRRDVNRDLKAAEARLDAIAPGEKVDVPNVEELQAEVAKANEHNASIERRKAGRERFLETLQQDRDELEELRAEIARLTEKAAEAEASIVERQKQVDEAEPLPEPIDTAAMFQQIATADEARQKNRLLDEREKVAAEVEELRKKSESYTKRLDENEALRQGALARAEMPIEGLGVDGDDEGLHVTFNGVPFVQISTAEQLRVSTAIAMAANPELAILRISDGSLLDDDSMAILRELATAHDFQLFVELVRPNEATGIILEDGRIKGQELEPQDRTPKRRKAEPDTPETVAEKASAGRKVAQGLQDAIDFSEGDETKGRIATEETYTQDEWDALPPARRAFLTKQGIAPTTAEGDDDNAE